METIEPPSLLITDDDGDFRTTLASAFERRGFHILLAADGREAVEVVQHMSVHLVLLDMHMPRLTGLEAIRAIKEVDAALPCILISAALDQELTKQAREAQAFSVLSKPVSVREVTNLVRNALRETYGWAS